MVSLMRREDGRYATCDSMLESSRLSWTSDEDFKNRGTREGANERRNVDTGYTYETYLRRYVKDDVGWAFQ
jgi:hypothetical protein